MALQIVAEYENSTPRFWCYKYQGEDGIFKFWIPRSRKLPDGRYVALPRPTTMDVYVEFWRDEKESNGTQT